MLIINETYAIKNDGLCYAICKKAKLNPKKPAKKDPEYKSTWYFNTLSQAVTFLIDRAVDIPADLELMAQQIEMLKDDLENALQDAVLPVQATKNKKE